MAPNCPRCLDRPAVSTCPTCNCEPKMGPGQTRAVSIGRTVTFTVAFPLDGCTPEGLREWATKMSDLMIGDDPRAIVNAEIEEATE